MRHPGNATHRLRRPLSFPLALRSLLGRSLAIGIAAACLTSLAAAAEPSATEPMVLVGLPLRQQALPLSEDAKRALVRADWHAVARALSAMNTDTFLGDQHGQLAFLRAWAALHSDRPADAAGLLGQIESVRDIPDATVDLVRGEISLALDDHLEALEALERVPEDDPSFPRAMLQRAEALIALERTSEAIVLYEEMVARPDPASGNPIALLALAKRLGAGSPKAYPLLRRVWTHYPRTQHSVAAAELMRAYPAQQAYQPTWQQVGIRAEKLNAQGAYRTVVNETGSVLSKVEGNGDDACRLLFARGRALYKLNQLTAASNALDGVGARCAGASDGWGARALYILGTARFRTGSHLLSAVAYDQLADLYPKHSMADDGLTRGGISLQEADDLAGAQVRWRKALESFGTGDTAAEASWRLAFSLYLEGKPEKAIQAAEALGRLPLASGSVHVMAGKYWSARWRIYPNVAKPHVASGGSERRAEAIALWKALCEEHPQSYYAILAHGRLAELAPDVARSLNHMDRDRPDPARPWVVRASFFHDPAVQNGVALARLGLIREARASWAPALEAGVTPDEMAWLTELRIGAGDWLYGHDAMRSWIKSHPVGDLGERASEVVRVAYPDRYWSEVRTTAAGYRYEPRLFHALVREESNFNRTIVSFAGARGLSQLMPPTARQTAGWLGMKIELDDLDDPTTNLKIGSKYLDAMHKQLSDSPFLSLAAYNAGAGRVDQWIGAWGNLPTDEYVERIPFRETRGYVKRVMDTWQLMRWTFDKGDAFPDVSAFNHKAKP
jgi:soluble lytic murein transglycosylase